MTVEQMLKHIRLTGNDIFIPPAFGAAMGRYEAGRHPGRA